MCFRPLRLDVFDVFFAGIGEETERADTSERRRRKQKVWPS